MKKNHTIRILALAVALLLALMTLISCDASDSSVARFAG